MTKFLSVLIIGLGVSFSHLLIAEEQSVNLENQTSTLSPKAALQRLLEGNQRFMADKSLHADRNQDRRSATAAKQLPFAVVLSCSDSRVPPELAFDQGIGDIFVVRVAGNIAGANELESVEYSAIHNHSSIVVVLGHQNCGAVKAVLANNVKDIESIAKFIKPAVRDAKDDVLAAVKANIINSVAVIKNAPPISKLMSEGKIDVVGALYNLESGEISLVPENK